MATGECEVSLLFLCLFTALLAAVDVCTARTSCSELPENIAGARVRSVRGTGEVASEFRCSPCEWNREKMREDVKFMLKDEEKKFIRFRAPVRNYTNPILGPEPFSGIITWVWVGSKFHYMLHYPHNFLTLSLATTDIIVSNMKNRDIRINCSNCGTDSCGFGYFELKEIIMNVSKPLGQEWEYLCLEADYGVSDLLWSYSESDDPELEMLNTLNFALPDIWYQARFLYRYYTSCTFLAFTCEDTPNYYCYDLNGDCVAKEVLSHYNVIVFLSIVLWLYVPILVFYLPSSRRHYSLKHIDSMFPISKTPVYFGRCIQKLLCYHISSTDSNAPSLVRTRRGVGIILLAFLSFRFLLLPHYQLFSWTVFFLFTISALSPQYISVYIQPEVPRCFPLFSTPYPEGIIKWNASRRNSIEYQKLSYVMVERIYVTTDPKFWTYLIQNSFYHFDLYYNQPLYLPPVWICKVLFSAIVGIVTFLLAVIIVLVYFILPLPYFTKTLFLAIRSGVYQHCSSIWNSQQIPLVIKLCESVLRFLHASVLCVALLYLLLTIFSLCFLVTEVTIFTYMGATIAADKVLHYFLLMVAFGTAIFTMIHAIHKLYSGILKDTIVLLENDSEFECIKAEVVRRSRRHRFKVSLHRSASNGVQLLGITPIRFREQLYLKKEFVSYISSNMYFFIVEKFQPIRRQVLLLFVKLFLMVFFIIISMWMKNVYKQENQVSDIFTLAGNMAVYFIPTALQWLSSQGQFGRRNDAQQRIEIVTAITDYIQMQSNAL